MDFRMAAPTAVAIFSVNNLNHYVDWRPMLCGVDNGVPQLPQT